MKQKKIVALTKHNNALFLYEDGKVRSAYYAREDTTDRDIFELGIDSRSAFVAACSKQEVNSILRTCVKADAVLVHSSGCVAPLVEAFPLLRMTNMVSFSDEVAPVLADEEGIRQSNSLAIVSALYHAYCVEHTPSGYCDVLGSIAEHEKGRAIVGRVPASTLHEVTIAGKTYEHREVVKSAGFLWCPTRTCWIRMFYKEEDRDAAVQWAEEYFSDTSVAVAFRIMSRKEAWK